MNLINLNENTMEFLNCIFKSTGTRQISKEVINCQYKKDYDAKFGKDEIVLCTTINKIDELSRRLDSYIIDLMNDGIVSFINRREIENLSNVIQLTIGAILYSDEHVLFLHRKKRCSSANDKSFSMVCGHCTYIDENDKQLTLREYFIQNVLREIREETTVIKYDYDWSYYLDFNAQNDLKEVSFMILHNNIDPSLNRHAGFTFILKLSDKLLNDVSSNEPEKADVVVKTYDELVDVYPQIDYFLRAYIGEIPEVNQHYQSSLAKYEEENLSGM